ncbi:MAG: ATP-grasp domain-containing protein [Blastocatellia bacterium]
MKIGVITKREKATKSGSVMQEAIGLLQSRGVAVEAIYPEDACVDIAEVKADCDLYLLKSGTEAALSLAGVLHAAGAKILNPYPTVVAMRDKIISTKMLQAADVPLPETYFASKPEQLADLLKEGAIVVKPFWAASQGRGVQIVKTEDELANVTSDEGVIFAQRYHQPDGLDHKLYVIGDQVFGVRRVWPPKTLEDKLGEPFNVPAEMREIALSCGRAFGVGLYGVDLITSSGKPFVVDINTFPGFKGVPNAAELLAHYVFTSGWRPSG